MDSAPTQSGTGNLIDKYNSGHPVIRWLSRRFLARFDDAVVRALRLSGAAPCSLLDVGTGEGVLVSRYRELFGSALALDLPSSELVERWRAISNVGFIQGDVQQLPIRDCSFDVVCASELLEHVEDPAVALDELLRVCRCALIVSVPREPLFRGSNFASGRYLSDLGNTPGHLNHWSRRAFVRFVANKATVREVYSPYPWTVVLAEPTERR